MSLVALEIPILLADRARTWGGADGERWLARLAGLVDQLVQRWRLELADPLPSHVSLVAPARRDGEAVVLKIPMQGVEFPYAQANNRRFEADALRRWKGEGSVKLLAFDEASGAMLLEACAPGTRLADECSLNEADEVACRLLRQLWRGVPSSSMSTTADLAGEWARRAVVFYDEASGPFERELLDDALALLELFAVAAPGSTLLHGDFHHNNVLAAQRQPWLAIDPLPLAGDREYDLVMFLLFRKGSMENPEHDWDAAITSMADRLHVRSRRVKEWLYVRLVCDALAYLSHGGPAGVIEERQEDLWSARLVRELL